MKEIDWNKIDYYWSIGMVEKLLRMDLLTCKEADCTKEKLKKIYKQDIM